MAGVNIDMYLRMSKKRRLKRSNCKCGLLPSVLITIAKTVSQQDTRF